MDGLNHFNNKVAVYLLVPYVLPFDSRIPDEFISYNDGLTTFIDGADLVFSFEGLKCLKNNCSLIQGMDPQLVVYNVHITNKYIYLNAFSNCELPIDYIKDFRSNEPSEEIFHQKYIRLHKSLNEKKNVSKIHNK